MPDTVSILDGNKFVVSDRRGDIDATPTDTHGLFLDDTRFLSRWVLTINGRARVLSIDELAYFQVQFFLALTTGTVYVDSHLSVVRRRAVGQGFHEEITHLNHDKDADRPRGDARGRRRLRRPVRGQGQAGEEGPAYSKLSKDSADARLQARQASCARPASPPTKQAEIRKDGLAVPRPPAAARRRGRLASTSRRSGARRREGARGNARSAGDAAPPALEQERRRVGRDRAAPDRLLGAAGSAPTSRSLVDLAALRFRTRHRRRGRCRRRGCPGSWRCSGATA